jgi:exopolyphosphatase / guanosine-5'-triphosphate,3'-diphosphate pyrophosphatase
MATASVNRNASGRPGRALSNGRSTVHGNGEVHRANGESGRGNGANISATPASSISRPPRTPTPHGLRIAAIDIGTNSLHMVIVEVTDSLSFKVISSEKDLTQLGSAALVHHHLTKRAMAHTMEVLARYQHIAQNLDCDVILAYATSAVRESSNGGDFVLAVKKQLGLLIQVISAHEEAHLIYLAVRQAIDLSSHPTGTGPSLIIDIGGGSCELIVGTNAKPIFLESFKLGASRLSQQFVHSDPVSKRDLTGLEKHIRKTLKPTIEAIRELKPQRVIGTSGTMENLAAMCVLQHGEEVVRHRLLTQMTRDDFEAVCKRLVRSSLPERRHLPGLDPGRAEQITAGAVLVSYLFDKLDIRGIDVCDRALREGMIIDYMQTHWPKVKLSVQIRDPRRRSVFELGRRCNFDEKHALQVGKLSLLIFDQLEGLHKLGAKERELLEYASLLHDIGWHIGHSSHHKHSLYLIKNGDLEGFSPNELDIIANIARYHRKSMPKKSHPDYVALDPASRELVWKLSSILRIADALDRGHYTNITSLRTISRENSVSIILTTLADPQLELWAARLKGDMFRATFDRELHFTATVHKKRAPRGQLAQRV